MRSTTRISLHAMFEPPTNARLRQEVLTQSFERVSYEFGREASIILDTFADSGAACCFLRLCPSESGVIRFEADGPYGLESCASGGWLLKSANVLLPTYWIPQFPMFRKFDTNGRMLAEEPASLAAFTPESSIEITTRGDVVLECAVWRLPSQSSEFIEALERPLVLECQPIFMLASHTSFRGPADVYAYLVHGQVYENRFDWRRKRKICSELEAYSLYVALHGLEPPPTRSFTVCSSSRSFFPLSHDKQRTGAGITASGRISWNRTIDSTTVPCCCWNLPSRKRRTAPSRIRCARRRP